ncbi:antifreeze protein [Magnetospirillum sp. SS-4]|uniref:antifreeze protein n=1 Tax=Magnetospirillum sp. SS-4 TaxID=2681465 RepID=UPI00138086EA|nr:antifreeze protein [Magnetospirillum sp. SS-4]CAA7623624.1 Antifreeze glycopeptide polyprotein [Magnetospirillum sp. SS-4]
MTSSLASRLAALALPAVMAAGPALAQPMPLTPQSADPPAAAETAPPVKVVPSPVFDPAASPSGTGGRFVMEELRAPDMDSVGVLDENQGGFGVNLWRDSPAELVRRFLPQIPAAGDSRAMRSLARRLLLTTAPPPEGNARQTPPLLELRAERLYAMGEVDGLASLLKAAPAALASPAISRIKVDTFLLAGDAKAACAEAATHGVGDSRLSIFCQLVGGKVLEANLALDVMRERKDADHAFIAAAEAMGGTPPAKVATLANPTPLHLAAFAAAKLPLPADAANAASPAMLRTLAGSAGLAADIRLVAAERAEAMGVMDTDSLRRLYGAVTLTQPEQQAAHSQGDRTPLGRVLMLRSVQAEQNPAVRADLLGRVLAAGTERGAFAATARLYAPLIADLRPSPDLAPVAGALARALYAAGRPETALPWVALARTDPATAKAADDLWPLARLYRPAVSGASGSAGQYAAWRTARDLSPEQAERRALVALDLLQAVGEKVPQTEWLALSPVPAPAAAQPRPAVKAMLRSAVEGLRLGETVLLSLVALGETGLDKVDADILNRVVTALRQVGLEREARELAIEAALGNGV